MKTHFTNLWKKLLITGFGILVIITLIFNTMLIRQTAYEESSQHLDELSAQIASSIEKQSRSQWNMGNRPQGWLLNLALYRKEAVVWDVWEM